MKTTSETLTIIALMLFVISGCQQLKLSSAALVSPQDNKNQELVTLEVQYKLLEKRLVDVEKLVTEIPQPKDVK